MRTLSREDKINLAKELRAHPGWAFFVSEMDRLIDLFDSKINAATDRNESNSIIGYTMFRQGLETAKKFPETTIKKNQPLMARAVHAVGLSREEYDAS